MRRLRSASTKSTWPVSPVAWAAMIGLLAACATPQPQGPYYGDENYLVLGVRPDAEATALAAQLEAAGYPVAQRIDGQDFTALGFADAQGQPARVRVVTARGIALALDEDEADAVHDGVHYELLPAPLADTHDADGDGFDELFVQSHPSSGEPPCILVYRVRDSGFVDAVPGKGYTLSHEPDAQDDAWREPTFCEGTLEAETSGGEAPAGAPPGEATESRGETKNAPAAHETQNATPREAGAATQPAAASGSRSSH